jgi:cytidine deaminase
MLSPTDRANLLQAAAEARSRAYAPYSDFRVGAAVVTPSGQVFSGCNIENASYGLTVCAERTAIFKAVSEGHRSITALAVCLDGGGSPCGACRQVAHEFGPGIPVFIGDGDGNLLSETTLDLLLPNAFGPGNLQP